VLAHKSNVNHIKRPSVSKFDLTRRQFINGSLASLGLYGITGLSNFVLADEPNDFDEVTRFLQTGKSRVPYVTLTEDGPAYPPAEIPWLSDFTAVGGKGNLPEGQLVYLFGQGGRPDSREGCGMAVRAETNARPLDHGQAIAEEICRPEYRVRRKRRVLQEQSCLSDGLASARPLAGAINNYLSF
jgi:hypothetical protein